MPSSDRDELEKVIYDTLQENKDLEKFKVKELVAGVFKVSLWLCQP